MNFRKQDLDADVMQTVPLLIKARLDPMFIWLCIHATAGVYVLFAM